MYSKSGRVNNIPEISPNLSSTDRATDIYKNHSKNLRFDVFAFLHFFNWQHTCSIPTRSYYKYKDAAPEGVALLKIKGWRCTDA